MNFRKGYINVRKKARGETREETRTKERKKEKNCELGVFAGTSDFNTFYRRNFLGFLEFVLRLGILFYDCNHMNSFVQIQVRIYIFGLLLITVFGFIKL